MKNISEVKNCYGCLACIDRCPVKCINLRETTIGHLVPVVNESECINCGACLKVCPDRATINLQMPIKAVASWAKSEECRRLSSSGAIATILAEKFIANGGVVYGCAFVPPFGFEHIRCTSSAEISRLRGSKYVQSKTNGIYKKIREDISKGLKVLFIGTPCQVAGAKLYVNHSNLFTIDLICHGVPSLRLLKDSIPVRVLDEAITDVEFRASTKFHFSAKNGISIVFDRDLKDDLYLKAFFTGLDYRNSCYKCRFAQSRRVGDITLGDFWGLRLNISEIEKEKGISVCLINTEIGSNFMTAIKDESEQIIRPLDEAICGNHQLQYPKRKTIRAKLFRMLYPIVGFKLAVIISIPEIYLKSKLVRS